jgi:deoxyribonuclease-4
MIFLGPGGTSGLGYDEGLKEIHKHGLKALEVEFTYGVRMTNVEAKRVGELAKKYGVRLSVHAPYYINLASEEKKKIHASMKRILDSCERAHHLKASHVVFHSAFYQKRTPEQVFEMVENAVIEMKEKIKENKWDVKLAPETTGKKSQFSGLDDLLELKKKTKCDICVDFAHLFARDGGVIDYEDVFSKIKKLEHIHSHFSGIEYTEKGERRHKITEPKVITPLAKHILKNKVDITVINESPDPVGDSVKMQKIIEKLR